MKDVELLFHRWNELKRAKRRRSKDYKERLEKFLEVKWIAKKYNIKLN